MYKKKYGEYHKFLATSYSNLGSAYYAKGLYKMCIATFKKAFEIFLNEYGKYHETVATTYDDMGLAYSKQQEYKEAQLCHQQSV